MSSYLLAGDAPSTDVGRVTEGRISPNLEFSLSRVLDKLKVFLVFPRVQPKADQLSS